MLNLLIGSHVKRDGRDFILTRQGAAGHAIYGPYVTVEPGSYIVDFEIAVSNEPPIVGGACALIDVVADFGQTEIAIEFVMVSALGPEPKTISIGFDIAQTCALEFRLLTMGHASLIVGDLPKLRLRRSDELLTRAPDRNVAALKNLFIRNIPFEVSGEEVTIKTSHSALGDLFRSESVTIEETARQLAERVGFKGDNENALYRAFVGAEKPMVSPPREVPFTSTLCQQVHFGFDQYRYWCQALKEQPKYYRKQWEFVFIAQALFERGLLRAGKKGLVFGAGQEPLPSLFASFGVQILATDQDAEGAVRSGWTATGQHTFDLSALNQRGICTDRMFSELVSFMPVDMNAIPTSLDNEFDFCWSACALEHLGSLEHGLAFIQNSLRALRPGGVAVHTTEFNLFSNADTFESEFCSFYRRRDIEDVIGRLERDGFVVSPVDWTIGEGFAERVADFPPYGRGEPHIRLVAASYQCTSIGLIITRPES